MTLPGVEVTITDRRPTEFASPNTSNWFAAGQAERGSASVANLITSMAQKETVLGERSATTALLHDALECFFREGGQNAYVGRVVGPAVATAAASADSFDVEATSPGEWGNSISVQVFKDTTQFRVDVLYDGTIVEQGGFGAQFTTVEEFVAWSLNSSYIRATETDPAIPASATTALTGGDSDHDGVTDTEVAAAIATFDADLGPGQVSAPGYTSASSHEAILAHCEETKRVGLLDAEDTDTAILVTAAAIALQSKSGARFGGLFYPWMEIPGLAIGTTRIAPPSGTQAGLIAKSEGSGNSSGDPVAGANGIATYPIGLSQEPVSDDERRGFFGAGVNPYVVLRDEIRCYGNRTVANNLTNANWAQISQSRTVMAVSAIAEEVAEDYYARKIDGRGFTVADYGQELAGRACLPFYNSNDLYGETPGEAFSVDVGSQVNSPEDLAAGILRAVIALRTSPGADQVILEIVKVPTGDTL